MAKREQKVALVTGANKGIGFEVARQLVREGFRVVLGARDEKAGRAAADKLNKERDASASDLVTRHMSLVTFLHLDISDQDSIKRAAEDFGKQSDRLDALVNNAGIALDQDKDVLSITPETLETTLRTNTLGALLVSQAFVPFLKKSDAPRIVNVSSGGGQLDGGADGWSPAYCISKTALNGVTSQLAAALPNFAVNSVCPGWSAPTWAARTQLAQWQKEHQASCGSPVTRPNPRQESFSRIEKLSRGDNRSDQ